MEELNPTQNKKKGNLLIIILIALVVILLGFIIINKLIEKKDNSDPSNENDSSSSSSSSSSTSETNNSQDSNLNNPLVKNLNYPAYNSKNAPLSGFSLTWEYINSDVDSMDRALKMLSASMLISEKETNEDESLGYFGYVTTSEMKKGYVKLFGPDAEYSDGNLTDGYRENCGALGIYDANKKIYHDMGVCGVEADPASWMTKGVAYKAEIDEEYIYVYHHFVYFLQFNNLKYYYDKLPISGIDYTVDDSWGTSIKSSPTALHIGTDDVADFNKLISENKLKTYKYTFKKQSDGNYYFFSGELQ